MQNIIKFHWFVHKILSGYKIMTMAKGHNSVMNLQKLMHNNLNLDLVNAYAKFYHIQSNFFTRYPAEMKFWQQLSAITML